MTPNTIKSKLVERGITQTSIARKLGVTPSTVNKAISGAGISYKVHSEIAKAMGLKVPDVWPDLYKKNAPRPRCQVR